MMLKLYYLDCKIEVYEFLYDKYINCIGDCLYFFGIFLLILNIYIMEKKMFGEGGGGMGYLKFIV